MKTDLTIRYTDGKVKHVAGAEVTHFDTDVFVYQHEGVRNIVSICNVYHISMDEHNG